MSLIFFRQLFILKFVIFTFKMTQLDLKIYVIWKCVMQYTHPALHRFMDLDKLILLMVVWFWGSSQFLLLPLLPLKMALNIEVVKIDSKIIILLN